MSNNYWKKVSPKERLWRCWMLYIYEVVEDGRNKFGSQSKTGILKNRLFLYWPIWRRRWHHNCSRQSLQRQSLAHTAAYVLRDCPIQPSITVISCPVTSSVNNCFCLRDVDLRRGREISGHLFLIYHLSEKPPVDAFWLKYLFALKTGAGLEEPVKAWLDYRCNIRWICTVFRFTRNI